MHKFLIHNKGDHVGVAVEDIRAGETVIGVYMDTGEQIEVVANSDIPLGHKIAVADLSKGSEVLKYNIVIGAATEAFNVGDYVHTHNIKTLRW